MRRCGCHSHGGFLLAKGPEGTAQRRGDSLELAGMAARRYLDRVRSVSGSIEVEVDAEYDQAHTELNRRLIHHGS